MSEGRSPRTRPRFTLARLMIAVAVSAPFLLILRGDEKTEMFLGAVIVTACVMILTYKLAADAIRRGEPGGRSFRRWQKVGIVELSFLASFVLIVTADLAFVATYELGVAMLYYSDRKAHLASQIGINVPLLVEGTLAALAVTFGWRHLFWLSMRLKRSIGRFRAAREELRDRSL